MSELDRQFDHLSLGNGAAQGSPQPPSQQQQQQSYEATSNGAPSSSDAPRSPFHSNAYGAPQQQQQQQYYDPQQQQQQQGGDPQSASARFERFFASPPAESTSPYLGAGAGGAAGSIGQQGGYAATGASAFGSFGHALPGGGAGSGHFGSQSGGSRRAAGAGGVARGSIPSQWDTGLTPSSAQQGYYPMQQPTQAGSGSGFLSHPAGAGGVGGADDDIISTAIVVKNIPFSVQKEQLLQIIEDLNIPMPYAFNYHFDGGNFRGLAFANFRSGEEADAVVAALNGFDVAGRKLRVEYKKVLQPGEKERIEKEKAIKRMQSMQLEKERSRHGEWAADPAAAAAYDPYAMPAMQQQQPMQAPLQPQQQQQQQQQMQEPAMTSPTMEIHPPYGAAAEQPQQQQTGRLPLTADSLRAVPSSANLSVANGAGAARSERSGGASTRAKEELDLNDAGTLEIYSRVLLFKDDRMRDELSFSRSLSPLERRTVHLVAQRLGLYHYSMGEGEERYVVVTKNEVQQGHRPLRSQASTIGRSTRGLLDPNASLLGPGSSATTGRAGLRGKKSAPDMKRARDADPSGYGSPFSAGGANGGLSVPGGAANLARKSNGNLREGYAATMGRSSRSGAAGGAAGLQNLFSGGAGMFDVPPVPSLPAPSQQQQQQSGSGHSQSPSGGAGGGSIRQPRGPPTQSSDSRNFAPRARVTVGASAGAALQQAAAAQQQQQQQQYAAQTQQEEYGTAHAGLSPDDVRSHEPLEI